MIFNVIVLILYEILIPLSIGFGSFQMSVFLIKYIKNYIFKREFKNESKIIFIASISITLFIATVKAIIDTKTNVIQTLLGL